MCVGEVDGVPAMWRQVPQVPFTAGLIFRVGRADEQLARAGVTHLLEHLALFEVGREHPDLRFNGQVDATTMSFHIEGTPEQAVEFVRDVATKLHALPGDRLEAERDILRAESSQHSLNGVLAALVRWRFGARGYALPAYQELGLHELTLDDLHEWAATFATKANAILWFTGEPPSELRIPLPEGKYVPAPDLTDMLPLFPCWFSDGPATVSGALSVINRSVAGQALSAVLERRLMQRVRYELGATYSPVVQYVGVHPTKATLTMLADPVPGQEQAVAREVYTALSAIADGDVPRSAIDAYVADFTRMQLSDPQVARGWIASRSLNTLLRARDLTMAGLHAELAELDTSAVAEKAAEAAASALYRLPPDTTPPKQIVAAPGWSPEIHGDRRYETRRRDPAEPMGAITVGPAGLCLRRPDGHFVSVRAQEAEALLVWQHDQRTVIGVDAATIEVNPAWWNQAEELLRDIDSFVPADRHVRMRDQIDPPPGPPQAGEPWGRWILVLVAVAALSGFATLSIAESHRPSLLSTAISLGLLVGAVRQLQRIRWVRGRPYSRWPR